MLINSMSIAGGARGGGRMLESAEAARRLGVKLPTLYAYVSRGLLVSHPAPGAGAACSPPRTSRRWPSAPGAGAAPRPGWPR